MNESEQEAVLLTESNFQAIHTRFFDLRDQCNEELDPVVRANLVRQLTNAHNEAMSNAAETAARVLGEPADLIDDLVATAEQAQTEIDDALADIVAIKTTLNAITKAVKTVASVVSQLK